MSTMDVRPGEIKEDFLDGTMYRREVVVGSRWIFEDEECEVIRLISSSETEVRFADLRTAIVQGPFVAPDADDFVAGQ